MNVIITTGGIVFLPVAVCPTSVTSQAVPSLVKCTELSDGRLLVKFAEAASAITPGQSAVFYDGNRVLGGAFIAFQQGVKKLAAENQDKFPG